MVVCLGVSDRRWSLIPALQGKLEGEDEQPVSLYLLFFSSFFLVTKNTDIHIILL